MNVDMHSHFIPLELLEYIKSNQSAFGVEIVNSGGEWAFRWQGGNVMPVAKEFYDKNVRRYDMQKMGIDKAAISVSPVIYFYHIKAEHTLCAAKICNDWAAQYSSEYPDRIIGMATLPMQDIQLSLEELRRAHEELGLNMLETAPIILGKMLDDPCFFPIYEYCEKNNILIFLHSCFAGAYPPYDKYYNVNLIGYVHETNIAINRLLFGGVIERFPRLKFLTSHGGGLFPYQFGRLMKGYDVRPETRVNISNPPDYYLKNIYFDTITHWTPALQFLCDNFGAENVMIGTDYPYDMGDYTPVERVNSLNLTEEQKQLIKSGNLERLNSDKGMRKK